MDNSEALNALLQSQTELQTAVQELIRKINRETTQPRQPGEVLTKLSKDDDIEAYLEVFERTAARERWPVADWASHLAPFLTGEAQRAYRDLPLAEARDYRRLKEAILASEGFSLPARAQRYHNWAYQGAQSPRPQVAALLRITHSWLTSGGEPPCIDRLVIDRCIRALPPDARKYASQVSPSSIDALIALLENHQVSVEMMRSGCPGSPKGAAADRRGRERRRATPASPPAQPDGPGAERTSRAPPQRRCYVCGQTDHISWACPERAQEASMATASSADPTQPCLHTGTGPRRHATLPVRINGTDTHALLDSGSAVTLVRIDLAGPITDATVPVTCVHGDLRHYPLTHLKVQTTRGDAVVPAGVVPNLPVPLLIGEDCVLFERYWTPGVRRRPPHGRRRTAPHRPETLHACPAFRPTTTATPSDSPAEEEPRRAPERGRARERGRAAETSAVRTANEEDPFAEFPQSGPDRTERSGEFGTAQWEDANLEMARQGVAAIHGEKSGAVSTLNPPYFIVKNGLLYRRIQSVEGDVIDQLLVPKNYISRVLYLGHTHQLGAHLGVKKTYDRIVARFYWPGIKKAVENFCRTCPECQMVAPRPSFRNPLVPLPIIRTPFSRLAMDIVGPLPKSARGHRYILVILDYATRYPEAIPLRTASAKAVAHELLMLFSRVGIAEEILTDQGTCFMSRVLTQMYKWLKVKKIRTSVYHPQTDGLVERFNQTLKKMLKKLTAADGKDWDQLIPYVLFAIREVPQASTGFSPFELLYGRRPRGLLDIAKEAWESQPSPHRSLIEHIDHLQERAKKVWPLVREHMEQAQREQARSYNRNATVREFQVGEKVLILVPSSECKFMAKWRGPYEIVEKVGPVNYKVGQPGRRKGIQIYHVNLLKRWHAADPIPLPALLTTLSPQTLPPVPIGEDLSPTQTQDVKELLGRARDVFSELPGRTTAIRHDIITTPGKVVRQRPYRIPEARRAAIAEEIKKMQELGVIEESHSPWSSPIVIVPKPDGTLRFCNDFRKLNEISEFDAYPMPRVDELIERLGPARFVSTLDLTKGYWQVPLTHRAKAKTAFATPEGLFQYTVLPFGVHGAPATFQRLMDRILRPHREYAAAYLDDIVIHSTSWSAHLEHLEAVLGALRRAGLTANAKKCRLGLSETNYLGYTIGRGCVKPQVQKVERVRNWPRPVTQKQVKSFLGLISYYQKFIKNYSTIAAPLYELTRQKLPQRVGWTDEAEAAFQRLKTALCEEPVLRAPDFAKPFVLHTDASGTGIGAVLAQVSDGEEHPITYVSRKLLKHEKNYATVEKECLAVKWAIHHLRYYLWGRTFTLITDHAPLKWMSTNKDRNARVTRWFLELQDYKFKVEHRPGKEIPHADALSRLYEEEVSEAHRAASELRGGVCGVSLLTRLRGKAHIGERQPGRGRVKPSGPRPRLGVVIDGKYLPSYIANQPQLRTAALVS